MKMSIMLYNRDIPHTEKKNILKSATMYTQRKSRLNMLNLHFSVYVYCTKVTVIPWPGLMGVA